MNKKRDYEGGYKQEYDFPIKYSLHFCAPKSKQTLVCRVVSGVQDIINTETYAKLIFLFKLNKERVPTKVLEQ